MKKSYIAIFALALAVGALLAIGLQPARHQHEESAEGDGVRWACPMMDYIGNRPGNCPVCGMKMQPVTAGELTRVQQERMGLELAAVSEGPAVANIRAVGVADYDHRFTQVMLPRVAGRIVKRHPATFNYTQTLEEGAPVVDLYSVEVINAQGELAAALAMGESNLVSALRQRFERWNLLDVADHLAQGGAVQDVVTLRSPFSGQVLLSDMEEGNGMLEVGREVMPDTPLLRLVHPDKRIVVMRVPEARAEFLQEGQAVALATDTQGDLPVSDAVIGRLAREIQSGSRTREVRVYLSDTNHLLHPGEIVTARICAELDADLKPTSAAGARFPLIPKTAVLSTGLRHVAWRVAERAANGRLRFEPVPLTLGPRLEDENGNDRYVVLAGLKPGDEVAAQGAFLIDSQAQLAGTPSLLYPNSAAAESHGR